MIINKLKMQDIINENCLTEPVIQTEELPTHHYQMETNDEELVTFDQPSNIVRGRI
jgi:hypothetical protein